jgi:uncharacterized protein YecE (DUF72 family)
MAEAKGECDDWRGESAMIRIGTCSWAEKSLVSSGSFYPPTASTPEARLRYYASRFDTVEVDSSYYALPDERNARRWADRTPEGFVFHVKAYGALTGHGVVGSTLPEEVFARLPEREREKKRVYVKERRALMRLAERFLDGIRPLRDEGKLGFVLFQYPPWFRCSRRNLGYIDFCLEMMGGVPLAVELRHGSWYLDKFMPRTLEFMRKRKICLVTADEPQFGSQATIPFVSEVTSDHAYYRFHGRNRETWLQKGITATQRFNYLYGREELESFVGPILEAARRTEQTYVLFNNHFEDKAVRNAGELKDLIGEGDCDDRS